MTGGWGPKYGRHFEVVTVKPDASELIIRLYNSDPAAKKPETDAACTELKTQQEIDDVKKTWGL